MSTSSDTGTNWLQRDRRDIVQIQAQKLALTADLSNCWSITVKILFSVANPERAILLRSLPTRKLFEAGFVLPQPIKLIYGV